jgi:hypothetical protein
MRPRFKVGERVLFPLINKTVVSVDIVEGAPEDMPDACVDLGRSTLTTIDGEMIGWRGGTVRGTVAGRYYWNVEFSALKKIKTAVKWKPEPKPSLPLQQLWIYRTGEISGIGRSKVTRESFFYAFTGPDGNTSSTGGPYLNASEARMEATVIAKRNNFKFKEIK